MALSGPTERTRAGSGRRRGRGLRSRPARITSGRSRLPGRPFGRPWTRRTTVWLVGSLWRRGGHVPRRWVRVPALGPAVGVCVTCGVLIAGSWWLSVPRCRLITGLQRRRVPGRRLCCVRVGWPVGAVVSGVSSPGRRGARRRGRGLCGCRVSTVVFSVSYPRWGACLRVRGGATIESSRWRERWCCVGVRCSVGAGVPGVSGRRWGARRRGRGVRGCRVSTIESSVGHARSRRGQCGLCSERISLRDSASPVEGRIAALVTGIVVGRQRSRRVVPGGGRTRRL